MEIVKQSDRILLRDGKVAINNNCCCQPGNEPCTFFASNYPRSLGDAVITQDDWPSAKHCLWFQIKSLATEFGFDNNLERVSIRMGGQVVWEARDVGRNGTRACITKPAGVTSFQIVVETPPPLSPPECFPGYCETPWYYTLTCDGCPEPEGPKYCCRDSFECTPTNPALQGGTVAFCRYVEPFGEQCERSTPVCSASNACSSEFPTPIGGAPWDCRNGLQSGGAFVQVDGYVHYDGDRSELNPCDAEIINVFEILMNGSWFVPLPCFGVATEYEIKGIAAACGVAARWTVYISLNLCDRTVSVRLSIPSLQDAAVGGSPELFFSDTPLEKVPMSCNTFSACYCTNYGGDTAQFFEGLPKPQLMVFAS